MRQFNESAVLPAIFYPDGSIECELVIFDLDGTIVDSGPGIKNSIKRTIAAKGLAKKTDAELDHFIGPPLRDSFRQEFSLEEKEAEECLLLYRRFYYQQGIYEATVYPGIDQLLKELKEKGYIIALGTSKPWVLAHRVLRHFNLRLFFDQVFGCYRDGRLDSKALVLQSLLNYYEENHPAGLKGLMIGDRSYDVIGAKAWGLPTIGVTYGYGSALELEAAGAALIVNQAPDIGMRL